MPKFNLKPDLKQAARFIEILTGSKTTQVTFQLFDDSPEKKKAMARIIHGTFTDTATFLTAQNEWGAGIFVTVNETDGNGRGAANITKVRAVFADFDSDDALELVEAAKAKLQPTLEVSTSGNKRHLYWLVSDCSVEQFPDLIDKLVAAVGSDKGAKGVNRVLRLPGFFHCKGEPRRVQVVGARDGLTYTVAQIVEAFGLDEIKERVKGEHLGDRTVTAETTIALDQVIRFSQHGDMTVREAMKLVPDAKDQKLRCGTPWRESTSDDAGIFRLHDDGMPFIIDSGDNTRHELNAADVAVLTWQDVPPPGAPEPEAAEEPKPIDCDDHYACMVREWKWRLADLLGAGVWLDEATLAVAWRRCFVMGAGQSLKFFLLDREGVLREFGRQDFSEIALKEFFGHLITKEGRAAMDARINGADGAADRKAMVARCNALRSKPFIEKLITRRTARNMSRRVDMFSSRGKVTISGDTVAVTHPFKLPDVEVPEVFLMDAFVGDFKEHFHEFDAFIDATLAARFAADRREAFVWLHAPSSWGKGLLMSLFAKLKLVVAVQPAMINKAINGETVGINPEELVSAWIVFTDEWKGAFAELKQMNSSMYVAAKYANRVEVELYMKFFASAEDVASLVNEGIEDQFNNRFAYLEGVGTIDGRKLFIENKHDYQAALLAYLVQRLKDGVAGYRKLGVKGAASAAEAYLSQWRTGHLLSDQFGDLSVGVAEVAANIRKLFTGDDIPLRFELVNRGISDRLAGKIINACEVRWVVCDSGMRKAVVMTRVSSIIKDYLYENYGKSEAGKLGYKAREVERLLHARDVPMDVRDRFQEYGLGDAPLATGVRIRGAVMT